MATTNPSSTIAVESTPDFTGSELDLVFMRHGEKGPYLDGNEALGKADAPGRDQDKTRIHISPAGAEKLTKKGEVLFAGSHYNGALVLTSDFVRTVETSNYVLDGDKTGLKSRAIFLPGRENMGFGIGPADWTLKTLPPFEDMPTWLEQCYFASATEAARPYLSVMAFGFANGIVDVVTQLQGMPRGSSKNLGLLTSHAPNVDVLCATLLNSYWKVDAARGVAEVDRNAFPGDVKMGEMHYGAVTQLNTSNPTIDFILKGEHVGYKLSDLKNLRGEFATHMDVKVNYK